MRGATEGINLIAQSWGRRNIQKDDEIVITWLEHHANIVPWQMLCSGKGAKLRVAPVDDSGQVLLDEFEKLLGPKTRLVSITQVSNALGVVTPADKMIEIAHRYGASSLMARSRSPTCAWMCKRWTAIFLSSPATRSSRRQASVLSTASLKFSNTCHLGKVVET